MENKDTNNFICEVRKSGNSLIITIPKNIIDIYDIRQNDEIEVSILHNFSNNYIKVKCLNCKNIFITNNSFQSFCPKCGSLEIEKIISERDIIDIEINKLINKILNKKNVKLKGGLE